VSLNWFDASVLTERAKRVAEQAPVDADPADEEQVRF
jgi:hypothetical protein